MATLGDKVTETIVGAGADALNAVGNAIHGNVKGDLSTYVAAELAKLPADHPLRPKVDDPGFTSLLVDFFINIGVYFIGILQSAWTLGEPVVEETRKVVWAAHMSRQFTVQELIRAWQMGMLEDQPLDDGLRDHGYSLDKRRALYDINTRRLGEEEIRRLHLRAYTSPSAETVDIFGITHTVGGGKFNATRALENAGYHVDDIALVKAAWEFLPGVQDLVRMAVREVWSPEIAEKFEQYADFPDKFATEAAKVGLSAETSRWYWAAHWDLPSVSQGYEMMHRTVKQSKDPDADSITLPSGARVQNVIGSKTMDLLLRAQDVMPFWRDKITDIAYQPLTRVDVRRMYQLGVLSEDDVYRSYRDLGYNDANATNLLEFTKVYYGPEDETGEEADRDWTKAEILDGYRKKIISADQAKMALQEMSYNAAKIDFFLAREDLKAVQTRKEAYIDRWHSLYIEGIATADEVSNSLVDVGVTKAEVDELLPLWYLERIQRVAKPTRAELNRFLTKGIITEARWIQEMQLMGYSDEYIGWYQADAQGA
jgi:hypothetical protein